MKRTVWMVIVVMLLFGCSGCSSTELESRNFPMVITVDAGNESFDVAMGFQNLAEIADEKAEDEGTEPIGIEQKNWQSAFSEGDEEHPKTMDYNHVKALILSQEILENDRLLGEFLEYMERQEVFARNTLLFTSDGNAADLLKLEGNLELSLGMYLEEMMTNQNEMKSRAVVTLGNLLNEYRNQMENVYIPVLKEQDGRPKIIEYYVLCGGKGAGTIDRESYKLAMLLEGKLNQYKIENGVTSKLIHYGDAAILLDRISTNYTYEKTEDGVLAKTVVTAEARLQNGRIATSEEQKQLKKEIEKQLLRQTDTLVKLNLWEKQLDLTNSYYRLGGYRRELYEIYQSDRTAYANDLTLDISYNITPVLE